MQTQSNMNPHLSSHLIWSMFEGTRMYHEGMCSSLPHLVTVCVPYRHHQQHLDYQLASAWPMEAHCRGATCVYFQQWFGFVIHQESVITSSSFLLISMAIDAWLAVPIDPSELTFWSRLSLFLTLCSCLFSRYWAHKVHCCGVRSWEAWEINGGGIAFSWRSFYIRCFSSIWCY